MKKKPNNKDMGTARIPPLPDNVGQSAVQAIWELYHLARRGRMDVAKASRLTYMLTAMVKAHEHSELERRIRELESRAGGGK